MIYNSDVYPERNEHSFVDFSKIGTEKNPFNGIKGPTILSKMIKIPDAVLIDYMHLICLGIYKKLLNIWFDSKNKNFDYYLGKFLLKKFYLLI